MGNSEEYTVPKQMQKRSKPVEMKCKKGGVVFGERDWKQCI